MSKHIRRIASLICFLLAVHFCRLIFTVRGYGFIDFSDLSRAILGVISAVFVTAALLLPKSERRAGRYLKLAVGVVAFSVILFAVFGSAYYIPPAREIVSLEVTVTAADGTSIHAVPTIAANGFMPDDCLAFSSKNVPLSTELTIDARIVIMFYADAVEGTDPIRLTDIYRITAAHVD